MLLLQGVKRYLKIGATSTISKTFTQPELNTFTALSGDTNPIHSNGLIHGVLILSQFSKIAGTKLPGNGSTLYKITNTTFNSPVYVNQELEISLTVERIIKNFVFCEGRVVLVNDPEDVKVSSQLVLMLPRK